MKNLIVSAHGTYTGAHQIFLDDNVEEVVFFSDFNKNSILYNKDAWPLLRLLADSPSNEAQARKSLKVSKKAGDKVENLTITGTKDFPSGVFEVGSGRPYQAILPLADGEETTLGRVVEKYTKNGETIRIYWLACTEEV